LLFQEPSEKSVTAAPDRRWPDGASACRPRRLFAEGAETENPAAVFQIGAGLFGGGLVLGRALQLCVDEACGGREQRGGHQSKSESTGNIGHGNFPFPGPRSTEGQKMPSLLVGMISLERKSHCVVATVSEQIESK
jgi:hypothetical protein